MLVVVSDIHFEECRSDALPVQGMRLQRNVQPAAFSLFLKSILEEAHDRQVKSIDFVLAGDVFDLHRTQLWFDPQTGDCVAGGPYTACNDVIAGSALEAQLLHILGRIVAEPDVAGCLRQIAGFPAEAARAGIHVTLHYLPGNHDRLVNATPALRREVVRLLGLPHPADQPFPHTFSYGGARREPRVLVRHGHEYDSFNFGHDYEREPRVPRDVPLRCYDAPTLGDFITVDVVSRLTFEFRRHYTDATIDADALLSAIYWRLIGFDDVRPQSALLDYLLATRAPGATPASVWDRLLPVVGAVLERMHDHSFLHRELARRGRRGWPDLMDVVQFLLWKPVWKTALGLPLKPETLGRLAALVFARRAGAPPESVARREEQIADGTVRLVVAGHTHNPQVALLDADDDGTDRYYINTGTWRNSIRSTPDRQCFGDLKAMTYVEIYGYDEDRDEGSQQQKLESFNYWSGSKQRWT